MKPKQTRKGRPRIYRRSHKDVQGRADEIAAVLREAFGGTDFNSRRIEGVVDDCVDRKPRNREHLIVLHNGKVVGGWFQIPSNNNLKAKMTNVGWFFVSPKLPKGVRFEVANRLANRMHSRVRELGFKRIETTIGTGGGERFLSRLHDYHIASADPTSDVFIWAKDL